MHDIKNIEIRYVGDFFLWLDLSILSLELLRVTFLCVMYCFNIGIYIYIPVYT